MLTFLFSDRLTPVDVAFLENDLTGPLYGSPYAPAAEESAVQSKEFTYPHRFVLLRREALTIYTQRHLLAHRMQSQPNQNEEDNALKEEVRNKFDRLEKDLACCSDTPKNDKGLPAQVSFNPDAFVDRLSEDGKVAADENAPSTQHIRRAAAYVRDQAIRNLLTEALVDTLPADGQAWTDSMHGKGINMRYLGLVASKATVESLSREDRPQPDKPRLQAIVKGLEREMVFRATKFVLRQALEQLDVLEAPAFLSHFLNCLLGFSITSSPRPDTSSLSNTILPQKLWTSLTSDVLHAQIRDQVARRFRYSLAEDWFATDLRKPQLLREVCTRCGIQLQLRQYIFEPASQTDTATQSRASLSKVSGGKSAKAKAAPPVALPSTPQTTFNPEDIVQVYPIVKSTRHEVSEPIEAS